MNDLIDRQAALNIFKPWLDVKGYSEGELNMLRAVIYELENMPSGWIKTSERLPETDDDVFVFFEYYRYGNFNCMCNQYGIGNYIDNSWLINGETGWKKLNVIAWMPIPEMPKENNNET